MIFHDWVGNSQDCGEYTRIVTPCIHFQTCLYIDFIKLNAVGHVVQVLSTDDLYPLENYICQSLLF
jgi:hypothetical protein